MVFSDVAAERLPEVAALKSIGILRSAYNGATKVEGGRLKDRRLIKKLGGNVVGSG